SAGVPRGLRACNPFGGWFIGGKVSTEALTTEPISKPNINRNQIRFNNRTNHQPNQSPTEYQPLT
ncbi:hypothetical protein, partial [Yersinia bercovieri]